ncbi:MAG: toll/interleukin-1 receptor domain-containing protein [Syntrophaceae bacterium]
MTTPRKVFVSYAHEDINYCTELVKYLKLLEIDGLIAVWDDGEIVPGTDWDIEIKKHVNEAEIMLLLVSNDFLISDYINKVELEQSLVRHNDNRTRVIPIIIKSCAWENSSLGKLQALPLNPKREIKPVSSWKDKDYAYFNIQEGVGKTIAFLNKNAPGESPPPSPNTAEDEYYRLYGLGGLRTDPLIQNFNVSRTGDTHNVSAIQFLWADALHGNTIDAEHIKDQEALRIRFNHKGGWGCNIAIRCQDALACHNINRLRYLSFDVRIPLEEIQKKPKLELLNEVGIALRIVDGRLQHWEYALSPNQYYILPVNKTEWGGKSVKVDLHDFSRWHQFTSDGNIKVNYQGPDFSIIASVILMFGSPDQTPGEPRPGRGIIDIREFKLTDI